MKPYAYARIYDAHVPYPVELWVNGIAVDALSIRQAVTLIDSIARTVAEIKASRRTKRAAK